VRRLSAHYQLAPEAMVPAQPRLTPEEDLWVAVLEHAIRAARGPEGLERRKARAWLKARRRDYIGGAGWVCDALGLDDGWPLRLTDAEVN